MVAGPAIEHDADELGPIVCLHASRISAHGTKAFQCLRYGFAAQGFADHDCHAFAAEIVDDGEAAKASTVEERIRHEIHAPTLVGCRQLGTFQSIGAGLASSRPLRSQIQARQNIQPVNALVIDLPSLPPQQDVDAPRTVANACLRNLLDALGQGSIQGRPRGFVIPRSTRLPEEQA